MKKAVLASLAGVAISLTAQGAQASFSGYVCDSTLYKDTPSFGNYGFISVSFYSGAHCTGTYLGYHYYCSQGATNGYCPSEAIKLNSEAAILGLQDSFLNAGRWGNYVSSYDSACRNGTTNLCGHSARIVLYANR